VIFTVYESSLTPESPLLFDDDLVHSVMVLINLSVQLLKAQSLNKTECWLYWVSFCIALKRKDPQD